MSQVNNNIIRWVVPNNNGLTKLLNSHINVECVSSVKAIKYIYKYTYKGHDRASVLIENDEIKAYQDCRYIGSSEAAWRILGFSMHDKSHAVEMLPVHLENMNMVYFRPIDDIHTIARQEKRSKLEAWFVFNLENHNSPLKNLTYINFCKKARWDSKDCGEWKVRKRDIKVIGRCPFVSPTDHERFALRVLLHHVPGATSYQFLKTFQNIEYPTFQEACQARGLLNDNDEYLHCLREAAQTRGAKRLRALFATILAYNSPSNVRYIWNELMDDFCEDFLISMPIEDAKAMALNDIDEQLQKMGSNIFHFDLPEYNQPATVGSKLLMEHYSYSRQALIEPDVSSQMTAEQKTLFDSVLEALDFTNNDTRSKLFFLDAPGGYGKTFVENALITKVRSLGKIVLAVASSGIASLLLPHGTTAHSQFKIPINLLEHSTCNISVQSDLAKLLKKAEMICWDEAPMHHRLGYEAVERTLKDLCGLDEFGGKVVLFSGDFRQTLPVVPKGSRSAIVSSAMNRCSFWNRVQKFKFTRNMRLAASNLNEEEVEKRANYSQWLLDIGDGVISDVQIPNQYLIKGSISDLIQAVFPNFDSVDKCAILAPTNLSVDTTNDEVLNRIPGDVKTYFSCDEVQNETSVYPVDFLNQLNISGLPPHRLNLKIGAVVMLLRNLNPSKGLMNGSRMKILQMMNRVLKVELLTGANAGSVHFIPRIKLMPSDSTLPFEMARTQFPIKLAYAITINKAQGQSLERVGLYLDNQVFSHGQLYVALSRATSPDNVAILIPNGGDIATNIVYKEALS